MHLLNDDIVAGTDELGVLLYGHAKNAYWYGSQLTIQEARRLAPYQNATALQVTSAVVAGMVWAIENPRRSVVEADDLDEERILGIMEPYLGSLAADGARRALPRGHRPRRSLAIPQHDRALGSSSSLRRAARSIGSPPRGAGAPGAPISRGWQMHSCAACDFCSTFDRK
jgi:hypothetical protein